MSEYISIYIQAKIRVTLVPTEFGFVSERRASQLYRKSVSSKNANRTYTDEVVLKIYPYRSVSLKGYVIHVLILEVTFRVDSKVMEKHFPAYRWLFTYRNQKFNKFQITKTITV